MLQLLHVEHNMSFCISRERSSSFCVARPAGLAAPRPGFRLANASHLASWQHRTRARARASKRVVVIYACACNLHVHGRPARDAISPHSVSILSAYMGRYLTLQRSGREESLLLKVIFFLLDPWRIQTAQYNGSIQVYKLIMDVYTCNNNNNRNLCFWEWFANNYYTNTITFLSRFWWEGRGKTTICLCDSILLKP